MADDLPATHAGEGTEQKMRESDKRLIVSFIATGTVLTAVALMGWMMTGGVNPVVLALCLAPVGIGTWLCFQKEPTPRMRANMVGVLAFSMPLLFVMAYAMLDNLATLYPIGMLSWFYVAAWPARLPEMVRSAFLLLPFLVASVAVSTAALAPHLGDRRVATRMSLLSFSSLAFVLCLTEATAFVGGRMPEWSGGAVPFTIYPLIALVCVCVLVAGILLSLMRASAIAMRVPGDPSWGFRLPEFPRIGRLSVRRLPNEMQVVRMGRLAKGTILLSLVGIAVYGLAGIAFARAGMREHPGLTSDWIGWCPDVALICKVSLATNMAVATWEVIRLRIGRKGLPHIATAFAANLAFAACLLCAYSATAIPCALLGFVPLAMLSIADEEAGRHMGIPAVLGMSVATAGISVLTAPVWVAGLAPVPMLAVTILMTGHYVSDDVLGKPRKAWIIDPVWSQIGYGPGQDRTASEERTGR